MLSKFPVTSERGQYLVKFEENIYDTRYYSFYLYAQKRCYGFKRMKRSASMHFVGKDWNYNFIEMANYLVLEYELKVEERNSIMKIARQEIESFKSWDGNIE